MGIHYYMKPLIRNTQTTHLIALIALCLCSALIWFEGPQLVIQQQYPLLHAEKRFYVIALIFLLWLLNFLFAAPTNPSTQHNLTADAQKKLSALEGRFEGALNFLKKTFITKQGKNISLSSLPWYLLIGASGAGKTSLLANATINFVLTKQFKQEKIIASDNCDWWATRDLVLIDVPGNYLSPKNHFLWDNFLNLIKKNRQAMPLNFIILALSLPDLLNPQNKNFASDFKQKMTQLRELFGAQLNFYFVVTQCDQLPGFLEFFSEYSLEESAQPWGILLPAKKENECLLDVFTRRFNALIKRLNNQLIWRLHQERNPNARPAIKDLPLQLERLKTSLSDFIKALSIPDLRLQGVYLTSATQPQPASQPREETASLHIVNTNANSLQLLRNPELPTKAYFIRQFILQGLLSSADPSIVLSPKKERRQQWQRRTAYFLSAVTIVTAAILLGRDFQQSVLQTYAIQNNLSQFQFAIQQPDQQGEHLLKALPLLNTLQAAAAQKVEKLSRLQVLSFYSDKSQKTATQVYQQALSKIVIPAIKNYFEDYLADNKNIDTKNMAQTYAVLKAYLMLGDQQNCQVDYIINILTQLLPNSLNTRAHQELISHVHAAFKQIAQPLELNADLITQVRHRLISLSSTDLALVLLKNIGENNSDSDINFNTLLGSPPIFVSNAISHTIPNLYTASAFTKITTQDIPFVAEEALKGNWILGTPETLPNDAMINALAQQIQARYIASYVALWENILTTLTLVTPTDLAQTDVIISNLMSNTSPLLQILQIVKQNTSFPVILSASQKIQVVNTLFENAQNNQENSLYTIFVTLRQLHTYLQSILNTEDMTASAFSATKNHLQNPNADAITQIFQIAEQSPEPMKTWLHVLADRTWFFILQETSQYVENAWQVNIITIYHSQIASRFPLNQNSDQEIDLQQFYSFAGKQGALANFYQEFLKPFVNDETKQWTWRSANNQKMPFTESVLPQIQQAFRFQNISKYILFTQGRKQLAMYHFQLPDSLISSSLAAVEDD